MYDAQGPLREWANTVKANLVKKFFHGYCCKELKRQGYQL